MLLKCSSQQRIHGLGRNKQTSGKSESVGARSEYQVHQATSTDAEEGYIVARQVKVLTRSRPGGEGEAAKYLCRERDDDGSN